MLIVLAIVNWIFALANVAFIPFDITAGAPVYITVLNAVVAVACFLSGRYSWSVAHDSW